MNTETKVTANREYKSTVFSNLFKDKKRILSLYNALNNSNYTNEEELEIVTLEDFLRENRAEVVAMSIFEFDEEKEIRLIREDEYQYGFENGREEGRRRYLIEIICKKMRKGKTSEIIAEELEEEISVVEEIYEIAKKFAPEYNVEEILKMEQNS